LKQSGDDGKQEKNAEDREKENKQKQTLKVIEETFNLASKGKKSDGDGDLDDEDAGDAAAKAALAAAAKAAVSGSAKSGSWGSIFGKKKDVKNADKEGNDQEGAAGRTMGTGGNKIPDTFDSMVRFNAGMTGMNMAFTEVMLRNFPTLVSDICSIGTLQEQTDFLALEIRKEVTGQFRTIEFRTVLMTSLAALLPRRWNTQAEQAWGWFWDSLDAQLQESLRQSKVHEQPVLRYINGLGKIDYDALGNLLWTKLFAQEREAELRHKQPTQTFVRIATLALQFTAKIFEDPFRMKDEIGQQALKHILHQVEPRLFGVFVVLMEEEVRYHSKDEAVTAGVTWALSVIASLMHRMVVQASNPVLLAAVRNDVKGLKKALGDVARKDRSMAALAA
jgi:hypothetical protein